MLKYRGKCHSCEINKILKTRLEVKNFKDVHMNPAGYGDGRVTATLLKIKSQVKGK